MSKKLGFDKTINANSGSFGSPSWVPLISCQNISETWDPAATPDTSDRSTDTYSTLPTRYNISADVDGMWNKGAGLTAIRTAFLGRSVIDLAVLDGQPATAADGYRGEFAVTKFNLDFPLLDFQKLAFTIKPHGGHTAGQAVGQYTDATGSAGTPETFVNKRRGEIASVNTSAGSPIADIEDWKMDLEWAEFEAGDRTDSFSKVLMVQLKVSAELNFIWNPSVAALVAFRTAFRAHSAIELFLLDDAYATSGAWGVHADFAVTSFKHESPLTEGQKVTVSLMPHGNAAVRPTFVTR